MTQRRRNRHRKRRVGRRSFLIGLGGSVSAALTYYLLRSIPAGNNAEPAPSPQAAPNPALPSGEWRAVWVSYLEFAEMDFSSESAFRADAAALMDNCLSLGLNTVIAQVRPFGDALYRSSLFPWSHLCTGVQGQDPGFDPLDVLLTEAHARGLSLEAWVNPYRLRSSASMPPVLAENSLLNTHPEWVCTVNEGAYLNPAIPEAADYVVQGVAELVQNYAVDGIHFDDYFYPSENPSLDSAAYESYTQSVENPLPLLEWRAANINAMVAQVYESIKAVKEEVVFGISPQGNIANDEAMGADVKTWAAVSGYVDYLAPQLYFSFENEALGYLEALEEWAALPRHKGLKLYAGLALYKVGTDADGGTWLGRDDIIALQAEAALAAGYQGAILYSSDYLDADQTAQSVEKAMAVFGK